MKDIEVIRSVMEEKRKSDGRTKMEGINEIDDERIQLAVQIHAAVLHARAQSCWVLANRQISVALHRINSAGQS